MSRQVRGRLLAAAGLFAFVIGLWGLLRAGAELPGDLQLILAVRGDLPQGADYELWTFFSMVATPLVAVITVATAATIVGLTLGLRAAALVVTAAAAVLVNDVVRAVLGPTPAAALVFGLGVHSYPSGHVVYATAVFGALAWLGWRHGRRDASVVLVGMAVAMGPARVLLGSHLPSDVLGGYALGGAWLLLVIALLDRPRRPTLGRRA